MTNLVFSHGAVIMKVRFLWRKHHDGIWYYRRRIPKKVREYFVRKGYADQSFSVATLKTYDKSTAVKRVIQLTKIDEEIWWQIENGKNPVSISIVENAKHLLRSWDLAPFDMIKNNDDGKRDLINHFIDHLEAKAPCYSGDHDEFQPQDYLSPEESVAWKLLAGKYRYKLSDAKSIYISTRKERKQINNANSSFGLVFDYFGDMDIEDVRRRDIQKLIEITIDAEVLKTATIKKRLGTVRAAVNELIHIEELNIINPFTGFKIPNLYEDADERTCLTKGQLQTVRDYVRSNDNDFSNILGFLTDTGARLSEIIGLKVEDVKLGYEIPYIEIHKNTLRRLKTKQSKRNLPLVGDALLAASRAVEKAASNEFLFSRYTTYDGIRNDSASATINKILDKMGCETTYWLRHTMQSRLKNVGVVESRRKEIHGAARQSVIDDYGLQTGLKLLRQDLSESLTGLDFL